MPRKSRPGIVTTIRFPREELERVRLLARKHGMTVSEAIREAIQLWTVDLINGEEEDALVRKRLADRSPTVDGETFIRALRKEFGI